MYVTAVILSQSLYGIILPHFLLLLWLHRRIVSNDCNAVYSLLILFLWSVIECYQYSLWHYINLNLVPVSSNGTFVFWIYIVITDDRSALVRQIDWYRQATNHYRITWTSVDDASWRHIASRGLNWRKWKSRPTSKRDPRPRYRPTGKCPLYRYETTGQLLHSEVGSNQVGCSCTWQRSLSCETNTGATEKVPAPNQSWRGCNHPTSNWPYQGH